MVYCDFIRADNKTVVYRYGGLPSDLTGRVSFNRDGSGFTVDKKPDKTIAFERHLNSIYGANKEMFKEGKFRNKKSYEYC